MAGDIVEFLQGLGLARYAEAFAENEIDLAALPHITEDDLKEIGVALGARRKLLAAVAALATAEAGASEKDVAPAAEQRQVSVLFADLAGFTRLSADLGAEATHTLLNRYFETVDGIIEGYGGSIDKHMGDNVMAVFGAPVAHSDDPERAARAALDIHQAMTRLSEEFGRPLRAHIGLASGQVVASGTGSAKHREYTVTGSSVNLASRLQERAEAGETLVSQEVQRAIAPLAQTSPMGEIEVKGFAEPLPVWRLDGLGGAPAGAQRAPFVGRRAERRQFAALMGECLDTGAGQAILLRGEAGIGKTRLIEIFATLAEAEGFAVHKGLVLDFGVGKGQDAVRALVRSLAGLADGSGKAARRAAADRAVEAGWLEAASRVFFNDLLDLPQPLDLRALYDAMDNATRNAGKQAVVGQLIRGASQNSPLLITVEDIHWADALTLAHLAVMASAAAACTALLVMTSRVEGDPLDQAWRAALGGSPLATMDLQPLRGPEVEELARSFVETGGALVRDCIARAEGNPLFLEQLLRNAEEDALTEVPGSIQSLVLARMDRLAPRDKQALQAASVIGQRFDAAALRAVMDDETYDCRTLMEHHLVRPEGQGYLFAHALIQEGVYSSLLQAQRRKLHRRAADCFAGHDPVLYAQHLDRAENEAAAGAYLAAARSQAMAYRYERAVRLVERGLALAPSAADRFELTSFQAKLLHDLGSIAESMAAGRSALELAESGPQRCEALIRVARCLRISDAYDEAFSTLEEAESLAAADDLVLHQARIHDLRGNLCFPLGRIEDCVAEHRKSLSFALRSGSAEAQAQALSGLGDAEYARGRMASSHEAFLRCVTLCRAHGFGAIEVGALMMVAGNLLFLEGARASLEAGLRAVEAAARVGKHRDEINAHTCAFFTLLEMNLIEEAEPHFQRAEALVRELGAWRFEPTITAWRARAMIIQGRGPEAVAPLQRALEMADKSGPGYNGARIAGMLALASRDPGQRRAALARGERYLAQGSIGHNHLYFYHDAINAMLSEGDWAKAESYAAALADYTRAEPLPWSDFFIARGRALAGWGRGRRGPEAQAELRRLGGEAERLALMTALPALEDALAEAG